MTESNDQLFLLIKSLSKSEKRYFKIFADKHEGSKDYLDLFDAIDNLKEYDEIKIKEKLKGKNFIKHFSVIKNYLFNTIIDSLHEFHSYDTAEYKVEEYLKKIKILYQKGLIDACLKLLGKAKKIAEEHEMFSELSKLLTIQHQISTQNSSQLFKKRKEIQQELQKVVEQSYNLAQYRHLELNAGYFINVNGLSNDSTEIKELLKHPLLLDKEKALSNRALSHFLKIHAKLCESKGQKKEALHYTYEIVKNLEQNSAILLENPLIYARTINTYLQSALDVKELDYFAHYLSALKNLLSLKIAPEHLNTIKGFYFLNLLNYHVLLGNFNEALTTVQENNVELANKLIPLKFKIGITYFECILLIGTANYKSALKLLNTTLLGNENIIIPLKRISRILNILVHFELSNIANITNEIDAAYKFLRDFENTEAEKVLLKYFKSLLNCYDPKEKISCYKKLKEELTLIEQNPKESLNISYFDFLSWVESKIENKPFQMIVKEKMARTTI